MNLEEQTTLDPSASYDGESTLKAGVGELRPEAPSEPEQLDRFRLKRLLGQGGMGQVWEAWDPELERSVAIKRLLKADPSARRRFVREARLQATLAHPGICPVFEVGQDAGEPYIVMPCLDGSRLDEAVDGTPLEYKLGIMRQVAEAIHAAHEKGLIHRDLKPANILVEHPPDAPPRPIVLDFGIARPVGGEMLTAPGQVVGTPAYMAPEQVEEASVLLDRRTDIYALGATLYRLLTGRPPHTGTGTPLLLSIVHDEPERLPSGDIPAEVEAIVFKCLEKEKNKRYDSAKSLAEDLGRYLAGEPVQARPVTRWVRLSKWARRHRVAVRVTSAATLIAMAGLAWGGWSAWRSEERQEVARRFGAQVEEIEALARYSHLVPLHDTREDQKQLRVRLDAIRPSLDDSDSVVRALAAHAMGRGHLALDELEDARGFLETAYELDPDNAEIAGDLGRTLSELYRDQLVNLERFGDQAKREEVGKELANQLASAFSKASELRERSEVSEGTPALGLLPGGSSRSTEDSVELDVLILFHDGRFEEALELLDNAPRAPSWLYERWRLEGDIRRSWAVTLHYGTTAEKDQVRFQLEKAREAYGLALEVAPSHTSVLLDDAQATSLLIHLGLVSIEESTPLIEQARDLLRSARISNPTRQATLLWAVRLELTAADHAINQALDPGPHVEAAIDLGQRALELDPRSPELWYELARAHELIGRNQRERGEDPSEHYRLAAGAFERVIPSERDYAYFTSLGILRMEIANHRAERGLEAEEAYVAAVEAYQSAAQLHSEPFSAWLNLGVTIFDSADQGPGSRMTKLIHAVEIFERTHRIRPKSMFPFFYLGVSRQEMAREVTRDSRLVDPALIELAVADLKRATELAPDRFEPWISLAAAVRLRAFDAYYRGSDAEGFLAEAREAYRNALELASEHSAALFYAGQIETLAGRVALRGRGDPTAAAGESASFCRRALEAMRNANALYCLADALSLQAEFLMSRLGNDEKAGVLIEQAGDLFEEALERDEDHIEALQSYPSLLLLEAHRLRQQGKDPTPALERAGELIEMALAVDETEITTLLVEGRWFLEQALSGPRNQRDLDEIVAKGHRSVAKILDIAPGSPEALRITQQLGSLTPSSL